MKVLQLTGEKFVRAISALIIAATLTAIVFGQTVQPQEQGKKYGDPEFRGEPISLKVVNADIREILDYITEQYGVNFVIDKSVKEVPVTVNVSDIPWNIALDSILQSQELGVQNNEGILRVAAQKTLATEGDFARQSQESKIDRSPLYTKFIRLNYARASGTLSQAAGSTGGFSGGAVESGVGSASTSPDAGGSGDQGILGIIKRRLSRRGAVEVDGRTNTLIITDVRENVEAIQQLVTLLDQPEPQVEIETRIVLAQRNFLRNIGTQLGINFTNPFGAGGSATAQGTTLGTVPPTGFLTLTTGIFGTAQLNAALNLAESKGQTKTIASPRVTALNNRPAQIESGQQIPVTTAQTGTNGGDVVFTTTFVNVPLRLSVTPQITDAGTVILRVVAENNVVNTTITSGATDTPGIDTQRMQTEVLVPDGGTTVVGGVVVDIEAKSQNRVPGIANIPLIGELFKNRTTSRTTNEILFFITPRIYRPDYFGNPTPGKISDGNRTTTILQPVPLGNPPSNSETPSNTEDRTVKNPLPTYEQPVVPTTTVKPPNP